jgi:hypothetical protein
MRSDNVLYTSAADGSTTFALRFGAGKAQD